MHNTLKFCLLFSAASPVFAHLHGEAQQNSVYHYKSPDNIEPFSAVEHDEEYYDCGGYLRLGAIYTETKASPGQSAGALSGELGCGYQYNQYIKAHVAAFGVLDLAFNSQQDIDKHPEFFNQYKDSYIMLGEAVLTLSYQNLEIHLGRQNFDSPHLDSDDLRMVANLFEAYLIDYHYSDDLYFGTGFVREASGWENGGNAADFVAIGTALGGINQGSWVNWISFEQESLSSTAWLYVVPEHLTMLYAELVISNNLNADISYALGFQYDGGQAIGEARIANINANTIGVMAAMTAYNVTVTTAYNKNFGSAALSSVGGGPFFTSLEDQTLDAVEGDHAQSILVSLEYGLANWNIGLAAGEFSAKNKQIYHTQEINTFMNYVWQEKLNMEFMYAFIQDKNSPINTHQVRAILTYQY
ncbi:MAG: OprD family outer membrane porin [Methyloprofundus sp.]|nr:OprD family outer membrane porin [Methyloprofundus sp.]